MQPGILVLVGISALLVLVGTQVSLGIFTIDEAVYLQGADTFRLTGGFVFDNGIERFLSQDLTWAGFLPYGPNGQTTQYPPGMSILGGWLLSAFELRGLLFLNVFATVGSLFVTRALARLLFDDQQIALAASLLFLLGTFVAEYAFAYWPHMLSVFAVNLSLLLFLKALLFGNCVFTLSALSGLVLGMGLLFRIDTILLLPVIGLLNLLFVRRWQEFVGITLGGMVGLAGPVVLLAAINSQRYGTWNPLSYGPSQDGGVSISSYGSQSVVFLGLGAGFVATKLLGARVPVDVRGGLLLAVMALCALLIPELRGVLLAYGKGVLDLIINAAWIIDNRGGVVPGIEGTLLFWGLSKKALGQSLPWIGVLLALVGLAWNDRRKSILILLLLIGVWTFPFLVQTWHGGLGANMRYFLPLLPALSILATWVTGRLLADPAISARQGRRLLLVGGVLGSMTAFLWMQHAEGGLASAHQNFSTYVFVAVAIASFLTGVFAWPGLRKGVLLLVGIGIGTGVFNGMTDTYIGQLRRAAADALPDLTAGYDVPVLIFDRLYRSAMVTPDQYVAIPSGAYYLPDPVLVLAAIDAELRVVMPESMGRIFTKSYSAFKIDGVPHGEDPMVDITRSASFDPVIGADYPLLHR
ncbi:hypothetical protein EF888_05740 [Silicimonas algicola]|uniref:4-amino-4-deoxy-L-arabinose transferase-like glycosyltransferase n=1 Tax=Silicimonas algicola TaxID=1826607 RepID=A0A316GDF9_9RHOB|nr:hypothetical protein [Silicimonas algicola]AZQ66686.1 hypothetical protein EF888_05740 [Silicimonas algicola]PWK59039.1 hypothetical protein C8D95_101861 [Silicimonas algicola]